jgi:hypothetical protein
MRNSQLTFWNPLSKAHGGANSVGREKKARPIGKFWDALAYSRIVEWGKDWKNMLDYVGKNLLEARGFPRDRVAA